ncbi:hypothetical protein [Cytobacillus firmus]|uniref:hypothetical protein n=1 Tax=Cytobacillus firmus TaxID=1399 RepID=UPI002163BC14|nr:hypothetical protein [Cytobacillus firmus]MCS0673497.1 hypothetical protein [Cytobacillus firmus]
MKGRVIGAVLDKRKLLSLCILIVPWLTVPLIEKKSFLRFLPATTFVNLILSLFSVVADRKKLWKVKNPIFKYTAVDFSYILGLFFITSIWVFKLTYGNFIKYLSLNIVIDYLISFPIAKFFTKVGIFEFKKLRPIHFFNISVFLAIIIYWYQYLVERVIIKQMKNST